MRTDVHELIEVFNRFHRKEYEEKVYSDHKMNEARTLLILKGAHPEGMMVRDLSSVLRVSSPFVTQLLNSMEESGLIFRKKNDQDRRSVYITLTEQGMRDTENIERHIYKFYVGLADRLGEEDSRQLAKLMNHAMDYIEEKMFK